MIRGGNLVAPRAVLRNDGGASDALGDGDCLVQQRCLFAVCRRAARTIRGARQIIEGTLVQLRIDGVMRQQVQVLFDSFA